MRNFKRIQNSWGCRYNENAPFTGSSLHTQTSAHKTTDEDPEVPPCSSSLKKVNSSCYREGIKSHPDSPCLLPLHNPSLRLLGEGNPHYHTQSNAESLLCLGEENIGKNMYSRRGARIWSGPRNCLQGRGRDTRRPPPETQRNNAIIRLKLN